jgi:hypothetical protein
VNVDADVITDSFKVVTVNTAAFVGQFIMHGMNEKVMINAQQARLCINTMTPNKNC